MKVIATKDAVYQAAENLVLQGHKPGMITYGMIREAMPEAAIGFFLHIPFPTYEIYKLIPER